jgi:hypothetical protein
MRQDGCYWVKRAVWGRDGTDWAPLSDQLSVPEPKWELAEWYYSLWTFLSDQKLYEDSEVVAVGPRLVPPDEHGYATPVSCPIALSMEQLVDTMAHFARVAGVPRLMELVSDALGRCAKSIGDVHQCKMDDLLRTGGKCVDEGAK